jgi:hypothetical protein
MGICNKHSRKIRWTAVLVLIVVVMAGCAEIEPYEPRNNREEGPQKGLFTGSQGEWVILGPKVEETDAEERKRPQNPTDDAQ